MTAALLTTFDTEWQGVINSTAPKYLKGYADETIRNHMLLSYLRKYGRIVTGANGRVCIWNIKARQQPMETYTDGATLVFDRHNLTEQAALNWRGYKVKDSMTEKEKLMLGSQLAIYDRYAEMIPGMMEAITDQFGEELYLDGNATGRTENIHGLESFLGAGTTVAADLIAQPSDSYAGLSTALGNIGGTWSTNLGTSPNAAVATDWPNGTGGLEYDFFSPVLLNYSSTSWIGAGSVSWESTCERVLRQGIIWLHNKGGKRGRPTMVLLANDLYYGYLNHQAAKQRIIVEHKESQDLGFNDTVNQEGVAISFDYDIAASTGYLVNVNMMELASIDSVLFGFRGPDYVPEQASWVTQVGFWGNARYRPRHFGKISAYA